MKKHRGFLSAILTIVLAVGMFFGGGVLSVFAEDKVEEVPQSLTSYYVPDKLSYMDAIGGMPFTVPAAGYELRVTAPNGGDPHVYSGAGDTYVFDQVGIYNFAYVKVGDSAADPVVPDRVLYEKTAYCAVTGEFELRVANGGADIPTYMLTGSDYKLPKADLYYKGEGMNDFEPLTEGAGKDYVLDIKVTQSVDGSSKEEGGKKPGDTQKYDQAGNYTVVYSARLEGGAKYYTKSFEVKVQDNLGASGNLGPAGKLKPKLTVAGVPTTGSLNTKITLPKATATHEYDANVKIEIKVQLNDVDIPAANVDKKTGFAKSPVVDGENKEVPVVFDNVYNTVFYPLAKGTYDVTYQAVDDFGGQSSVSSYKILVQDRSAPTLSKIDEWRIPSTWGLSSNIKRDESKTDKKSDPVSNLITFPYPEYTDNSATEDDNGVSRVSFEIKDTVNNVTVVRFHNIYAEAGSDDAKYVYSASTPSTGYYKPAEGDDDTFDKETGFIFDFEKYTDNAQAALQLSGTSALLGRYTAQYQARDKDQNITTKTYDITLQETYEDIIVPSVKITDGLPDYVYLSENVESFTVPTAVVTDAGTARTHIEYTISVDDTDAGTLEVKSGERLQIVKDDKGTPDNAADDALLLANADYDKDLAIADQSDLWINVTGKTQLTFKVVATDAVGNTKTVGSDTPVRLVLSGDVSAAGIDLSIDTDGASYSKVNPDGYAAGTYTVNIPGIASTPNRIDESDTYYYNKGTNKDNLLLGSFVIKGIPAAYRNFVGFELKLTGAEDGAIYDGISFNTYPVYGSQYTLDEGGADDCMIVVDDLMIAPSAGKYNLMIRAFDINGVSVSKVFDISVGDSGSTTDPGTVLPSSIVNIGTSADVNVTYTLKNRSSFSASDDTDTMRYFMVRKISDVGNFSLMGSEFTAFSQGQATFEEGYYQFPESTASTGNPVTVANPADLGKGSYEPVELAYGVKISDVANVVFEVQGTMPVYSPKDVEVKLPSVVAHNTYANAVVTAKLKYDKNDGSVSKDVTRELTKDSATGGYKFTPKEDAKYSVTYYASINGSDEVPATYVIVVGDNLMPSFTVFEPEDLLVEGSSTKQNNLELGGNFAFSPITVNPGSDDLNGNPGDSNYYADIQFTKILRHPNGTYEIAAAYGNDAGAARWKPEDEANKGFKLDTAGEYTVEYSAKDRAGNEAKIIQTFTVSGEKDAGPLPFRILSTVLIILAVLLIAGIVLYFLRFQKKKIKG